MCFFLGARWKPVLSHTLHCMTVRCEIYFKLSLPSQSRYGAADRGVRLYSSLPMRPNPDGKRLPSTGVRLVSTALTPALLPLDLHLHHIWIYSSSHWRASSAHHGCPSSDRAKAIKTQLCHEFISLVKFMVFVRCVCTRRRDTIVVVCQSIDLHRYHDCLSTYPVDLMKSLTITVLLSMRWCAFILKFPTQTSARVTPLAAIVCVQYAI